MPLHTEAFTQRSFYTEIFTYRCSAQRCFCTHKGTQALLHAEPFTQRSLCTEQLLYTLRNFYTVELWPRETCTHRLHKEAFTHRNFYMQKLYPEKLSHTEFFPHRCLYAQKFLRTAAQQFLHTDAFTHRCFYTERLLHTETCAHSTLLHTASFYTERLCFPFLTTYLSCSPFFWLVSGYMGLYENGVPDNPMVYHHFPPLKLICHIYSYIIYIHIPGDGDIPLSPNACWLDMPISSRKSSINLHFIWLIQKKTIAWIISHTCTSYICNASHICICMYMYVCM